MIEIKGTYTSAKVFTRKMHSLMGAFFCFNTYISLCEAFPLQRKFYLFGKGSDITVGIKSAFL